MKETILDILIYLFENYEEADAPLIHDHNVLKTKLSEAGFAKSNISKAFNWLKELSAEMRTLDRLPTAFSNRFYNIEEMKKLDAECRGFLLFLEQQGILDAQSREWVIERLIALESDNINSFHLKWIVLMVLSNQPGQKTAFDWLEQLLYHETPDLLH